MLKINFYLPGHSIYEETKNELNQKWPIIVPPFENYYDPKRHGTFKVFRKDSAVLVAHNMFWNNLFTRFPGARMRALYSSEPPYCNYIDDPLPDPYLDPINGEQKHSLRDFYGAIDACIVVHGHDLDEVVKSVKNIDTTNAFLGMIGSESSLEETKEYKLYNLYRMLFNPIISLYAGYGYNTLWT